MRSGSDLANWTRYLSVFFLRLNFILRSISHDYRSQIHEYSISLLFDRPRRFANERILFCYSSIIRDKWIDFLWLLSDLIRVDLRMNKFYLVILRSISDLSRVQFHSSIHFVVCVDRSQIREWTNFILGYSSILVHVNSRKWMNLLLYNRAIVLVVNPRISGSIFILYCPSIVSKSTNGSRGSFSFSVTRFTYPHGSFERAPTERNLRLVSCWRAGSTDRSIDRALRQRQRTMRLSVVQEGLLESRVLVRQIHAVVARGVVLLCNKEPKAKKGGY